MNLCVRSESKLAPPAAHGDHRCGGWAVLKPMKTKSGTWMMRYGLFLIAVGAVGYLSNPQKAATALISGGVFGSLSILWGWLMTRGIGWSHRAAFATTGFLLGIFCWRAFVSWQAYAAGAVEKRTAAILITLMGTASLAMLTILVRSPRPVADRHHQDPLNP